MKKAILLSALLGWASVPVLILTAASLPGAPPTGGDIGLQLLVVTAYAGVIAFPACLAGGALVNQYLPPASLWWRPGYAALCGGFWGAVTVLLFMAWIIHGEFPLGFKYLLQGFNGAVPGAVCGFSLARFKQKLQKPETSSPPP